MLPLGSLMALLGAMAMLRPLWKVSLWEMSMCWSILFGFTLQPGHLQNKQHFSVCLFTTSTKPGSETRENGTRWRQQQEKRFQQQTPLHLPCVASPAKTWLTHEGCYFAGHRCALEAPRPGRLVRGAHCSEAITVQSLVKDTAWWEQQPGLDW